MGVFDTLDASNVSASWILSFAHVLKSLCGMTPLDINEFMVVKTATQVRFLTMLLLGSSGASEMLSVSALYGARVLKVNYFFSVLPLRNK